jgi:hypothetical protein
VCPIEHRGRFLGAYRGKDVNGIRRATAVLAVCAALCRGEAGAAASPPGPSDVHALLDVPYLSQTPALCGGAAVAMLMRYWGQRDVFPQDFATLVGPGEGGILTGALASAVRGRGWQAVVVAVAGEDARARIRSEIDQGRPIIALIEVGPHTYHYVVIVGSTDQQVVLHDPARAPFRVLPWADFDKAWVATGRWMMLVLPPDGYRPGDAAGAAAPSSDEAVAADVTPCRALVERGVDLALAGDRDGAEAGLVAATNLCPGDPASWRELAGLRFSQSRWPEAQALALSAARLAPDDTYAWQLVATSRYLMGDLTGALAAWNRTGDPHIDAVDIHGAGRTRQPVVAHAAGLQPRQVLTPEAFGLALRRVGEVPSGSNARMSYESLDGGLAKVNVFFDSRPLVPSGWVTFASMGARALLYEELQVDVAGPLGAGDLESVSWRWSAERPRVALDLAVPSPKGSGTVTLDASWEDQSYDATPSLLGATVVREPRRRVGLHLADWSTSWLRWQTGAALDTLREHDGLDATATRFTPRDYLGVESALDIRLAGDHLALGASEGWWAPFAGGDRFATGALRAAWRSTSDATRPSWSAVTGIEAANRVAPLALWSGAGTGEGRSELLRAHPLLEDDVLTGAVFGRDVAHATFEYDRPVGETVAGGLSVAAFVDTARAWHLMNGLDTSPLFVDAGVGVRLRAPGPDGGVRIDVAHGLRGGGTTLSAGWVGVWPR